MACATRVVGYVRTSPLHRDLVEQERKLRNAGCTLLFVEREGYREIWQAIAAENQFPDRPALDAMLREIRSGDLVIVWRLDRLGRSLTDLADILWELSRRKVGFRSLCERIDTTGKNGDLVLRIVTAIASFDSFDAEDGVVGRTLRRAGE
ncbi:MAG: recombinase family protein [Mesorhizobium sp.]